MLFYAKLFYCLQILCLMVASYRIQTFTVQGTLQVSSSQKSTEAYILTLPGKCLDVSELVNKKKKFRNRGGREGALYAMQELAKDGMGELKEKKSKGSVKVNKCFVVRY